MVDMVDRVDIFEIVHLVGMMDIVDLVKMLDIEDMINMVDNMEKAAWGLLRPPRCHTFCTSVSNDWFVPQHMEYLSATWYWTLWVSWKRWVRWTWWTG